MQLQVRKLRAQRMPLGLGFLHAVLAEQAMTSLEHRKDAIALVPFADGNQPYFCGRREGGIAGRRDVHEYRLEIRRRIGGYEFVVGDQFMASALSRAKLARAAVTLNARTPRLPALILMTDEKRFPDPYPAAKLLPKGSAIILRHTDANARATLAENLSRIARRRGLILLIANDGPLAARFGCQGVHLSEAQAHEAAHLRALHPSWLITAAAHSARAVARAHLCGADAVLLAAPFPTESHVGRAPLGATRFNLIARSARLPVYALGGINARNMRALGGPRLSGIAAIEALVPD